MQSIHHYVGQSYFGTRLPGYFAINTFFSCAGARDRVIAVDLMDEKMEVFYGALCASRK